MPRRGGWKLEVGSHETTGCKPMRIHRAIFLFEPRPVPARDWRRATGPSTLPILCQVPRHLDEVP
jgi:hypothetical protein